MKYRFNFVVVLLFNDGIFLYVGCFARGASTINKGRLADSGNGVLKIGTNYCFVTMIFII